MKISIIIPTYNSEKTITSCLKSILSQSFKDFEILIIDGLSTDNTLKICNSFNDKRIRIVSEKDNGIYYAMNKALKIVKGQWLYFLGSDDALFDNNVLENCNNVFNKTNSKVIYGNVLINGDTGWGFNGVVYDHEFDLKKILEKNICHQAIFYNKEIFDRYQYNINFRVCADYELNLKLFSKYHFEYVDLIIARFNSGGLSSTKTDLNFNLADIVIENYFNKLFKNEFYPFIYRLPYTIRQQKKITFKIYLLTVYLKHKITNFFK